jgi:hypothetical protein
MAGLGTRTWSTGDTVSAVNFQGYLQDQVIAVFATTSARDTAMSSPSDGQFAYVTAGTGALYVYDNSAWTAIDLAGDISSIVTASNSSMAGGATSGAATLTVDVDNTTVATATATDYVLISDASDSNATKKALVSDITALATGDITGITTAAASGLEGGATSGAPSLSLNLPGLTAAQAFGSDGSGVDVTFHSDTAGDSMVWDSSAEKLTITGTDGQTALDIPDGNVTITDALTVTGAVTAGSLVAPLAINAQTGTTYTLVIADAGKLITSFNGSAQTITVPPNSSVAFAVGTQIIVQNIGSANATLAQGSGVTINSKDSAKEIDGQYAAATLIKTATDAWSLIGALA